MKKLPVGIEFFAEVIQKDYYYVDKTNMIKELLKKVLLQSFQIDSDDKEIIQNLITNKPGSVADLALTLKVLSRIL